METYQGRILEVVETLDPNVWREIHTSLRQDATGMDPNGKLYLLGVANAQAFERRYRLLSERKPSGLKGEEWGRALGRYATEHPARADDGQERALLIDIRAAFHGRASNYDLHQQSFTFDPVSFELIQRRRVPDQA